MSLYYILKNGLDFGGPYKWASWFLFWNPQCGALLDAEVREGALKGLGHCKAKCRYVKHSWSPWGVPLAARRIRWEPHGFFSYLHSDFVCWTVPFQETSSFLFLFLCSIFFFFFFFLFSALFSSLYCYQSKSAALIDFSPSHSTLFFFL